MITKKKIEKILTENYVGDVYNIEVVSNDDANDDLYWICNGIVVHNCFPKDLNALIAKAKEVGHSAKLLSAINERNLEIVKPEHRDWERMLGRAVTKK